VVWRLEFGGFVLLHPERVNSYAGALVRAVRKQVNEIGCIPEDEVIAGNFEVPRETRLTPDDEPAVLRAMVETLLSRGLCLREPCEGGAMLVFPSYYRRDRPVLREHPPPFVAYRFTGSLDEVYTTLVVRLHHTRAFTKGRALARRGRLQDPGQRPPRGPEAHPPRRVGGRDHRLPRPGDL